MKHKLKALMLRIKTLIVSHKKISITLAILFLVLFCILIFSLLTRNDSQNVNRTDASAAAAAEPEPETIASPLTGLQVSLEDAARPVTAIVIENSPDARPQSSLPDAGFVFESIAEGGITRFVAVYQESQPKIIGPVRSLRPYFTDIVLTFNASIAHVGGSAAALEEARELGLKDLDQFTYGDAYYRTTDRFAPHNVYTDFGRIDSLNERLGFEKSDYETFPRKNPKPIATPKASTITVNVSSFLYQSSYTYDKKNNNYKRFLAGEPHIDRESKKQLTPDVVTIIEAPFTIAADGRYSYDLLTGGKATIFQDGNAQVGNWTKEARDSQFVFTTDAGDQIKLNPGQLWMSVISPSQEVEYQP